MSIPLGPRRNENRRGTYAAQDSEKELTRLTIHDRLMTRLMGGVLSEQTDPSVFHRVLDVGCGPGSWVIETAQTYPEISLVGIDISKRMIEYARTQAQADHVDDRVKFRVMDALMILEFPTGHFDLVNLRLGFSFLRTWDWPKMISELLRVTRPDGVVRITEPEFMPQSNSPALTRLFEINQCAFYRSGHFFTAESLGVVDYILKLFKQHRCQQVQRKHHTKEYKAGTEEGEAFYQDWMYLFRTAHPFFQKWGCTSKDYEAVYQQALDEMCQPDFRATMKLVTVWGNK